MIFRYYVPVPADWCIVQSFFSLWFTFTALLLVCSIAVYQCFSLMYPRFHRKLSRTQLITYFVAPCWLFPLPCGLLSAVRVLGEYGSIGEKFSYYCEYSGSYDGNAAWIILTLYVFFPSFILLLSNASILYKIVRARYIVAPDNRANISLKLQVMPLYGHHEKQKRVLWGVFLPTAVLLAFFYIGFTLNKIGKSWYQSDPFVFLWLRMIHHSVTSVVAVSVITRCSPLVITGSFFQKDKVQYISAAKPTALKRSRDVSAPQLLRAY